MCTVILDPKDQRFIYDAFTLDKKTAGQTYDVFCAYLKNQRRSPKGIHPETLNRVRSYISVQIKNRPDMETRELEHWDYVGNLEASRRLRNITHAGAVRAQAQHETHTTQLAHQLGQSGPVSSSQSAAGAQHQHQPGKRSIQSRPQSGQSGPVSGSQSAAGAQHQPRYQPIQPRPQPGQSGPVSSSQSAAGAHQPGYRYIQPQPQLAQSRPALGFKTNAEAQHQPAYPSIQLEPPTVQLEPISSSRTVERKNLPGIGYIHRLAQESRGDQRLHRPLTELSGSLESSMQSSTQVLDRYQVHRMRFEDEQYFLEQF